MAGWALFLPAGALGVGAVVVLVGALAGWHPLWPERAASLSEAVALRDLVGMRQLVAAGADPNATYRVRADLVKSEDILLTPLEAAVTTRERYVVEAVLALGAAADETERRRMACFALAERAEDVVRFFAPDPGALDCRGLVLPW